MKHIIFTFLIKNAFKFPLLSIPLRMKLLEEGVYLRLKETFNSFEDETVIDQFVGVGRHVQLSIPLRMKLYSNDLYNTIEELAFQFL